MSFWGGGGGGSLLFPSSAALKSNNPSAVRIENLNCPNSLKPKQDCKVNIIFKPQEVKKYDIDLSLKFPTYTESLKILGEGIHDETLSIISPLKGTLVNSMSSLFVSGICDLEGADITIEPTSKKSRCIDGVYTTALDLTSELEGAIKITVEMATGHIPVVESVTVIKTPTAPKIFIVTPLIGSYVNSSNQNSFPVTGTCNVEGGTVSFSPTAVTTTCMSGAFSKNLNLSAQPEGNLAITASIKDSAGNTSSSSVTVLKKALAPQIAITNPSNGTYVNAANQNSFPVSGTCSINGGTVSFSPTSATTACIGGAFSKNLNLSTQAEGNITITANIQDSAGNSSSSSVTVIKNASVPQIAITTPSNGAYVNATNQSSFSVSGTCNVESGTVSFSPTSVTATCMNGSFSKNLNLSTQAEGNITITASIQDAVGNTSSSSVMVVKKALAPQIAITNPSNGAYVNSLNQNSFSVSGTCNINGSTVSFSPTSVTTACISGFFSKNLNLSTQPEGNITITASIQDTAGNNSSSSVMVVKDTMGPQVTLGAASPNEVSTENSTDFSVSYTGANSVNLTSSKVTLTGDTTGCALSVLNGTTQNPTLRLSACSSNSGQVTVQIQGGTAQDTQGNLASASNTQSVSIKNGASFIAIYGIGANDELLELPLKENLNYNFTVDWGDDTPIQTVTSYDDPNKNHTYSTKGVYTVTIDGLMEGYGASPEEPSLPYQTQLLSVPNLGNVGWKDLSYAFYNASNLTTVNEGDTSNVTNMAYMFYKAYQATPKTLNWNTSKVTNMAYMFYSADKATPETLNWNTSNVTNMRSMFSEATNAAPNTSNWNTSNVTDMRSMFSYTSKANPDTLFWDTSKVTNMGGMFYSALEASPNVLFWDTSKVTDMTKMFARAPKANPDISNWNLESIISNSSSFSLGMYRFFFHSNTGNPYHLTSENYSRFLIKVANSPAAKSCSIVCGGISVFGIKPNSSTAISAKNELIDAGWSIDDSSP